MKSIESLRCFIKVVEEGSFSAASRKLNLAVSSVSRYVQLLEDELGTPLLTRNTRQITLTEAGRMVYEQGLDICLRVEKLGESVAERKRVVRGLVRITAPLWFGSHQIGPVLVSLQEKWPDLLVQIDYNDKARDPYAEEYDLYVQISKPKDSALIARPLKRVEYWLCSSPQYLKNSAPLNDVSDLESHQLLKQSAPYGYQGWHFYDDEKNCTQVDTSRGRFASNTSLSLFQAALNHAGVVMLAREMVEKEIKQGSLVRLLESYRCIPYQQEATLHPVYSKGKTQEPKSRVVVDALLLSLGAHS